MFRVARVLLLLLLTCQFLSEATNILPREEASSTCVDGCSKRTLFNIVWGCLSTTIICAWTAIHPNVPPREGPLKGTLRRLELMFWTIIAPEILPAWALNQRLAAMTVRDVYNEGKGYEPEKRSFWITFKSLVSLYEIKDPADPAWTLKHGHFLIMGGIHIVEPVDSENNFTESGPIMENERVAPDVNLEARGASLVEADMEKGRAPSGTQPGLKEGRVTILTLEMLRELVKDPEFKIPLTEDDITYRSKGDALSKMIFVLQSSWFIVQCLARVIQGLDLTQLELTTVALASLNGITFILWWDKPLGAQALKRVYMKRKLTDRERNAERNGSSSRSMLVGYRKTLEKQLTNLGDIVLCRSEYNIFVSWFFQFPFIVFKLLLMLVLGFTFAFFLTITDIILGGSTSFPADATHVPTFYAPNHQYSDTIHSLLMLTLGTLFGGIHCSGWNLPFPAYSAQKLWRVASLAVTIIPFGSVPIAFIIAVECPVILDPIFNVASILAGITLMISMFGYVSARLVLLGQGVALLRHLPPGAFIAVNWSQFYPHFF